MATTGEYLVNISTLTTGTAMEHFLNIETTIVGGVTYISVDEIIGTLEKRLDMKGSIEIEDNLIGGIEVKNEIIGEIQLDKIQGTIEKDNNLKGEIKCP